MSNKYTTTRKFAALFSAFLLAVSLSACASASAANGSSLASYGEKEFDPTNTALSQAIDSHANTETEYGDIENTNDITSTPVIDETEDTPAYTEPTSAFTLDTLTEYHKGRMEQMAKDAKDIQNMGYTLDEAIEMIESDINSEISLGLLPDNANTLFKEYLAEKGFFDSGNSQGANQGNNQGSNQENNQNNTQGGNGGTTEQEPVVDYTPSTPPVQNETAPQPSYDQQQGEQFDFEHATQEELEELDKEMTEAINKGNEEFGLNGRVEFGNADTGKLDGYDW